MKILLTGGTGRLGRLLQKDMELFAPSHEDLDITKELYPMDVDLIIHAAAYTNVARAEVEKSKCLEINTFGTFNLLKSYPQVPFVYISTEYAKHPINTYAKSKLMGEMLVKELSDNYLIIRTLFKENPFPYPQAFVDQYTQGDYIDLIEPMIVGAINAWDGKSRTVYIGTGRKTIYELASQTRSVEPCFVDDIKEVKLPKDYL